MGPANIWPEFGDAHIKGQANKMRLFLTFFTCHTSSSESRPKVFHDAADKDRFAIPSFPNSIWERHCLRNSFDPSVNFKPFVLAAMEQGVDQDVAAGCRGEDGQPFDDGGRDEVNAFRVMELVPAAHGSSSGQWNCPDKPVPKWSLGTRDLLK